MIMADLSWGHINIFHGVQEVSAHRVCKEPVIKFKHGRVYAYANKNRKNLA